MYLTSITKPYTYTQYKRYIYTYIVPMHIYIDMYQSYKNVSNKTIILHTYTVYMHADEKWMVNLPVSFIFNKQEITTNTTIQVEKKLLNLELLFY